MDVAGKRRTEYDAIRAALGALPFSPRRLTLEGKLQMDETTLYRFYDAEDGLLYIGVTSVGPSRWSDHEHHRTWWAMVDRAATEHYPDRASALAAEKAAIAAEHPPWNTQHRFPRSVKAQRSKRRRNGSGTVILRDDGRWAFVCRVDGRQRWTNVRTEAEAVLLLACYEHRGVTRSTRDKATAILAAGDDWDGTVPLYGRRESPSDEPWDPYAVDDDHPCVACGSTIGHTHPAGTMERALRERAG